MKGDELSSINVRDYVDQFPFENIVFEGGGAKGVVYPGALLVLLWYILVLCVSVLFLDID